MNRKRILISVAVCAALLLVASLSVSAQRASLTPNEQLGKLIFFDEALSINGNQSCATCHAPEVGWTGPDSAINAAGAVYEGSIPGAFGDRKPPSSAYATQSPILSVDRHGTFVGGNFWDGRATGEKLGNPAADQAQGPFLNPKEQALPDSACVVYFVCTAAYDVPFTSVWGEDACDIAWPADVETVCATVGGVVVLSDDDRAQSDMNYDSIALSIGAGRCSRARPSARAATSPTASSRCSPTSPSTTWVFPRTPRTRFPLPILTGQTRAWAASWRRGPTTRPTPPPAWACTRCPRCATSTLAPPPLSRPLATTATSSRWRASSTSTTRAT